MTKIKIKIKILLVLAVLVPHLLSAGTVLKGVKQFNKTSYGAASQNWSVSSTNNGTIYFANHQGLLEFDGTTWQLYKLPNQTILRSVNVDSDSLIYTSGYMELGFWKPNELGKLQYHSLNSKAKKYFTKNIEFWNIVKNNKSVYFHSFTGILVYQSDSIFPIEVSGLISTLNNVHDKVLCAVNNRGIYELTNNKAQPFLVNDFFEGKLIRFLLPYKNDQILVGTASNGIFVWDGNSFRIWKQDWQDYFITNELNRGYFTKNGQLILGTIIDGISIFDKNEIPIKRVNTQNGLSNNTVLGIDADSWGNIWLALDDGIGFVSRYSDDSFSIEEIQGVGAIYSTAIFNDKLYLGTNQGLFIKEPNKAARLVPGTQGQVWDCKVLDNKLWVGHNAGTFIVENETAKLISETSGGFSFRKDLESEILIQSTYTNLVAFQKDKNDLIKSNLVDGFYDLVRYIEIDHLGNIWASHMHLGVFKIETDDKRKKTTEIFYYGENTFGQEHSIHVFKVENRIVFTTNEKIFTYDDLNDTILSYNILNKQLGKYASSHRIIQAPNHHYWFISKSNIGLFEFKEDKFILIKDYPTSLFTNPPLVDLFENILPLTEKTAILSLQNGIVKLDASVNDSLFVINKYNPVVRILELRNNNSGTISMPINQKNFKLKHNFNNLRVRISFPYISNLPVSHQFLLEGLTNEWSEKVIEPEFNFERLPMGKYNLKIKSSDIWGNESKTIQIPFEVLAPWYISSFAIFIYLTFLVLVLFAFRSWGIRQTKRKEYQQHEKREKELIRIRNEKLRNEIRFKSKELANSTMAIIKKNEFLLNLKKNIEKQKTELGTRYPDKYFNYLNDKIDTNISNQDDWQVFETNFERAHEQFFGKIKDSFPELTSSDLRLCAYLRMNLSSKEIAPLLGISVRGIENHRYRLRKKMNLQHDDSLTDTIHSI